MCHWFSIVQINIHTCISIQLQRLIKTLYIQTFTGTFILFQWHDLDVKCIPIYAHVHSRPLSLFLGQLNSSTIQKYVVYSDIYF